MSILRQIVKEGFIKTIQKRAINFLGINRQQENIDTLFYYINNYVIEASSLPPTKDPDLRIMQLCDTELMNILDKIFKKHNLTYWLDFGTLLGAYRHKGMIPWDDDMDISMPREDYNRVTDILKEELDTKVFEIHHELGRIGIGYKHNETGIWCDIFAVDTYATTQEFEQAVPTIKDKIAKYRKFYLKNMNQPYCEVQKRRKEIINEENGENAYNIIYHGREFNHLHPRAFYIEKDIYPITEIEFEGYRFSAPANTTLYLEKIFGKNYMQLPKGGILHHDMGRGALSTWAKKSNTDMKQVLYYLKEYASRH